MGTKKLLGPPKYAGPSSTWIQKSTVEPAMGPSHKALTIETAACHVAATWARTGSVF